MYYGTGCVVVAFITVHAHRWGRGKKWPDENQWEFFPSIYHRLKKKKWGQIPSSSAIVILTVDASMGRGRKR